jgi:hypothetical protein
MFEIVMDNTYILLQRKAEADIEILVSGNESERASFNFSFEGKFSIFQFHTFTDRAVK